VKVTKEKIENSQAYLTVEMEPDEIEKALQHAYKVLVKKANIPGFRKGKAPRPIVESYLGKDSLLQEAVNDLIPDAYDKAIKEQNLTPIDQPKIEVSQMQPVIFKAVVPLPPNVSLGDYTKIRVEPKEAKVNDEEIEHVIDHLRHQNATWEPVERPVAYGDMITIDIKSDAEGKVFVNHDGIQYVVEQGTKFPAPGFVEQMVGMNRSDTKEFKLSLPSDYARPEFAGKEVSFKVKVNEIKQEKLPEVNDDFAKTASPECQDLKSLRERISTDMKSREADRLKSEYEDNIMQELVNISQIEYPPVLVEREITRLINQQFQYLQMSGINIDEYIKTIKKTPEEMRADIKPRAEKRIKQSLVLEKLGENEKLEVNEEEINAEIENILKSTAEDKKAEMRASIESSRASIKEMLVVRKALQKLVEIGKTDYTEIEVKEKEAKNE
jgi:trigger factor